ncbi:neural cell adhesion molecule 1 [Heterodontus francisci]|uniref:neural cell adhesion molecule 1 n=1 Tax=Heterodontus francisci TaxID=7792 RepID=UPI00355BF1D9
MEVDGRERMSLRVSVYTYLLLLVLRTALSVKLNIAPSSGYIQLDENKVFICKVEDGEADEFMWYKPDGGEIEENEDDRFIVTSNEYDSQLQIVKAQTTDNGFYECVAITDEGDRLSKSLRVEVIQMMTFQDVSQNPQFDEGETAILLCKVIGIPEPTVSWTRSGRDVTQRGDGRFHQLANNSLEIRNIEVSDAGMYECVGKIEQRNEQISSPVTVTVNAAPKLLSSDTELLYSWLGNPINISCAIWSLPHAAFAWTRDGEDLPLPIQIFTVENMPELTSVLEVTLNSEADFGKYKCTAQNRLGEVSRTISVKEADFPSAPWNVSADPHSTTVTVSFTKPESDGGIPLLGYKLEWRMNSTTDWSTAMIDSESFRVRDLEPYTPYQFRAAAHNGRGLGNYSRPITARTLSIREPDSPKLTARNESTGNSYWIFFEDEESGGSPIIKYNIKYKEEEAKEWITDSVNGTDAYLLQNLKWATKYQAQVTAENIIALSRPTLINFSTPEQPPPPSLANAATQEKSKVGTGGIIGIIMVIFLLLLVAVDVTCYYTNRCGILMCIAVNLLGKEELLTKRLDQEMGVTMVSNEPKANMSELHTGEGIQKYIRAKSSGTSNDKFPLTKSETTKDKASSYS